MPDFTSYEKLSKKEQRKQDALKRGTWGGLNPVTRCPPKPSAYNRNAVKRQTRKETENE